jgi:hypothetical protein
MKSQKQRNRAPRPVKFGSADRQLVGGSKGQSFPSAMSILAAANVKVTPVKIVPAKPQGDAGTSEAPTKK